MFLKAAILYGKKDFRIDEIKNPKINDKQYHIRVKACGICHSEIHQWDELNPNLDYPRFIGHEVAGEIIDRGKNVSKFKVGERVAVWIDGKGYAEEIAVEEKYIFPIADDVSFSEALAEPIGCTTNGVLKAELNLNDTVALVGTGFMGLIMIQELKLQGLKNIIAIDVREEMLNLAGNLGADTVINPIKDDVKGIVSKLTNGKGVDAAFEVGGNETTLNLASDLTRMEGKIEIFGFHPGSRKINDLGFWNWMAFDIINGHFRNIDTILNGTRIGMDLLNSKKIDMSPLITHKYRLEDINKGFADAHDKPIGFVKAVVEIGE